MYPKTSWEINGGPSATITLAATIAPASAHAGRFRAAANTSR
jgi:hypothetical protein